LQLHHTAERVCRILPLNADRELFFALEETDPSVAFLSTRKVLPSKLRYVSQAWFPTTQFVNDSSQQSMAVSIADSVAAPLTALDESILNAYGGRHVIDAGSIVTGFKQKLELTRRRLLEVAGGALGTALLPSALLPSALRAAAPPPSAAEQVPSSVMDKLSVYMSEAAGRALPAEVTEKTKQHVLDTLAAMVSGSELGPGRAALEFSRGYGGNGVATVVAANFLCGPIEAALTNGMLAHADETDDSHAPSQSHPGCAVIAAALATGERFGINGAHFLRAVALGYDVGPRFTMTLGGQRFETESHWSTHSISPLFGAAAAAGCAARLNAQQMRWMLGYAAHQSSGLGAWSRDTEHVQKAFHFGGMTARSGVTSALLVQAGWTGVDDMLSGKDNFFAAYNPAADPLGLIDKLGDRYEIVRTNIKKWSVGSPIQAALDALQSLRAERPFEADHVRQITVRLATDEAAIVNNREIPDICLQHVIAIMLLDKTITFAAVHDKARLQDPATLRARARVQLVPDEELERLMPLRVAIVDVQLADGTHLSRRVDDVRGTPKNPMTQVEIVAKATDLIVPVLGATKCTALIEKIVHLESVADMRELRPLLQRG
jgi:2-methylcitrate dehydratase PrpD